METTTSSQGKYIEFEDKVKRTVFLDNLLPKDTISVLTKALGQFGKVISIEFLPNYTQPRDNDQCALVEMENEKQAQGVITGLSDFPFMMTGMPRPVRARIAQAEMFSDRPNHPGQSTKSRWVSRFEPNFMVVKRLKHMIRRHEAEASFLLEEQMKEEKQLAQHQEERLRAFYKKYEMIEAIISDGSVNRLERHYNIRMKHD